MNLYTELITDEDPDIMDAVKMPSVPINADYGQPPKYESPVVMNSVPMPAVPVSANYGPVMPNNYMHLALGPDSSTLQCPHCNQQVKTKTWREYQKSAHIAACVLSLCLCWLCCCIPYCMASFKNVHHKCPECKGFIGTYKH